MSAHKLFGTAGIRGKYLDFVTPHLASKLGFALGHFLKNKGSVAIGYDSRTTRDVLFDAFASALLSSGINVYDLGEVPVTVVGFASLFSYDASVMITASHNPPEYNGFKFYRNGREFLRSEESDIEKFTNQSPSYVKWNFVGSYHKKDLSIEYMNYLIKFIRNNREKLRIAVDCVNGATSRYTPYLLTKLGHTVVSINAQSDGYFPAHLAEPSERNLEDTINIVKELDVDFAIAHDGDGDRIAVITSDGTFINTSRIIALMSSYELSKTKSNLVITTIDTSYAIDFIVSKHNAEVIRTRLGGLVNEIVNQPDKSVAFASEPWKPIFPYLGLWIDGIFGALRLTEMISNSDKSLNELLLEIPNYPMVRKNFYCSEESKDLIFKYISEHLPFVFKEKSSVDLFDGIRINMSNGSWVLIRKSGTEPKIRLYAEASNSSELNSIVSKTENIIKMAFDEFGELS